MKGCGLCWVLGFDSVCASGGERERESAVKKQIQKPSSSTVARLEKEEEPCCSNRHCFGLLLFLFLFSFI